MRTILFFFCILCCLNGLSAQKISQQVLNSTGKTTTLNTIELSWSVGEPEIATLKNSTVVLTQGFLQPDVHVHNSSIETINISNDISVFPNPVHDQLFIKQSSDIIETMSLYNALGQRIMEQKFESPILDMSLLKPGIYFINLVTYGHREVHTFKIIKY